MDANDVCPEFLHLPEIGDDLGPIVLPVILQQPAVLIVVVVEPPGDEPDARRSQDEASMIVGDPDTLERGFAPTRLRGLDQADHSEDDTRAAIHKSRSSEHPTVPPMD